MPDAIAATVKFPEFVKALRAYEREVTNKTLPQILNKRGLNISSKAASAKFGFTKRVSKEQINAIMGTNAPGTDKKGKPNGPWLFVLTNAKRRKHGQPATGGMAISQDATTFLNKRRQGVAYIAAGWTPAIAKFGGHPRKPPHANSLINRAENKLATAGDLLAILENTAKGAGEAGAKGLERAIDYDTQDMLQHVARLQKVAHKYSAK